MLLPLEKPATLFLEGTLLSGEPSPRYAGTLAKVLEECRTGPKPTPDFVVIEMEDGSLHFRGAQIDEILSDPFVWKKVKSAARDEPVQAARILKYQRVKQRYR